MQSIANLPVIGLDLAKSVFQLHIVDAESGEIQRRQIKRARLTEFFAKCQPSLVAMEACGSSHYWARTIGSLGHQVKLLPAQHVKAFLLRDNRCHGCPGDMGSSTTTAHIARTREVAAPAGLPGTARHASSDDEDAHHADQCPARHSGRVRYCHTRRAQPVAQDDPGRTRQSSATRLAPRRSGYQRPGTTQTY